MPQLYENQVRISGTSGPVAKEPGFSDAVANGLSYVGNIADNYAKEKSAIDDARLKANVNARTKEALELISNADEEDFNYDKVVGAAKQVYTSAFSSFDKNTIDRFSHVNPDHESLFAITAEGMALEKSRKQEYSKISREIPQMSSEVAMGYMGEQDVYDVINSGAYLTSEQREGLKNAFKHDVDLTKIDFAIASGKFDIARDLIANTEKTNTLTGEERASRLSSLNAAIAAENNRRNSAKGKEEEEVSNAIYRHALYLEQNIGYKAAEQFLDDVKAGRPVGTESVDGKEVPSYKLDGIDLRHVDIIAIDKGIKMARGRDENSSRVIQEKVAIQRKAEQIKDAQIRAENSGDISEKMKVQEDAADVINGPAFNLLSRDEQKTVLGNYYSLQNDVNNALYGVVPFGEKIVYNTGLANEEYLWSPATDASFAISGSIGALTPEQKREVARQSYSGGLVPAALEQVSLQLKNVVNGEYEAKHGTVGEFLQNELVLYGTMNPASASKIFGSDKNGAPLAMYGQGSIGHVSSTYLKMIKKYRDNGMYDKPLSEANVMEIHKDFQENLTGLPMESFANDETTKANTSIVTEFVKASGTDSRFGGSNLLGAFKAQTENEYGDKVRFYSKTPLLNITSSEWYGNISDLFTGKSRAAGVKYHSDIYYNNDKETRKKYNKK